MLQTTIVHAGLRNVSDEPSTIVCYQSSAMPATERSAASAAPPRRTFRARHFAAEHLLIREQACALSLRRLVPARARKRSIEREGGRHTTRARPLVVPAELVANDTVLVHVQFHHENFPGQFVHIARAARRRGTPYVLFRMRQTSGPTWFRRRATGSRVAVLISDLGTQTWDLNPDPCSIAHSCTTGEEGLRQTPRYCRSIRGRMSESKLRPNLCSWCRRDLGRSGCRPTDYPWRRDRKSRGG
jgi:hypothetical protein